MLIASIAHHRLLKCVSDMVDGVELRFPSKTPILCLKKEGNFVPAYSVVESPGSSPEKTILSYHNFECTPDNLDEIFAQLTKHEAFAYKIATMARSVNDALRLLLFGRRHPNLSVIPMGERGAFGRVLGPIVGNTFNFASVARENCTAPGQLTAQELLEVYNFRKLGPKTKLYGLIGDPVDHSQGHLYHNALYRDGEAVYVKMQVTVDELPEFFPLARALGFKGLSVTMPLKEKVLPFLDEADSDSVNTILFDQRLKGTSTDGMGATQALGGVGGKTVALLGSGGVAKAISHAATLQGARVLMLGKEERKAPLPAHDILINCTPLPLPIPPRHFHSNALVMDCVYTPKETPFLLEAKRRGCAIVYGEELFFNQAAAQHALWF